MISVNINESSPCLLPREAEYVVTSVVGPSQGQAWTRQPASHLGGAFSVTAEPSFNYKRYLASREWALIKRDVAERSNGICERCHMRDATEVHHLTYEHIGNEKLHELQHVCSPCHRFESAVSDWNPAICNCDPVTAWEWADLLADEPPDIYGAALRHAREVTDAYR